MMQFCVGVGGPVGSGKVRDDLIMSSYPRINLLFVILVFEDSSYVGAVPTDARLPQHLCCYK